MLGISPTTLNRWARHGRVPSRRTAAGLWTFERSELAVMLRPGDVRREE